MTISADILDLLGRLGIDVLTMLVLVGVLYRSRQSVPSMPLVLSSLNIGLFAALAAITQGNFNAAIGFGLFGLLSMLRLRSAAFTIKDVAYTFLALIIGLINGLPDRPFVLLIIINIGLLIVVAVTDTTRNEAPTRVMRLTLEHAYSEPAEVRAALEQKLGVTVTSIVIEEIDFVRETTQLTISYEVDEAWGRASAEQIQSDGGAWTP
jgi:hypothetical protein